MKFLTLLFLAISLWTPVSVEAVEVQPHVGYKRHIHLYRTADALGKTLCPSSMYVSYQLEYDDNGVESNDYHPHVSVRCVRLSETGQTTVHPMGVYAWGYACPGLSAISQQKKTCRYEVQRKPAPDCECTNIGNPIDFTNGEKIQIETDLEIASGLRFRRHYSSVIGLSRAGVLGTAWLHTYAKAIVSQSTQLPYAIESDIIFWENGRGFPYVNLHVPNHTYVFLPTGRYLLFERGPSTPNADGTFTTSWTGDPDSKHVLTSHQDAENRSLGWTLRTPENTTELYSGTGQLLRVDYASGRREMLTYSDANTLNTVAPRAGLLIQVSDSLGKSLSLAYDAQERIVSLTGPGGVTTTYSYDSLNRLEYVTLPGGARRQYHYNEVAFQPDTTSGKEHYLTGISDELIPGVFTRYSTYTYAREGPAVSTEHSGLNKYTRTSGGYTDPNGASMSYSFTTKNGVRIPTLKYRRSLNSTSNVSASFTSDSAGNITEYKDFNGKITRYSFDTARNLETSRIEAYGTAVARTISTEWHPILRLPVAIAEPKKRTTVTYDATGNVLTRTEQATTDASGTLGFSASTTGQPRTWTYSYNANGQVLTATGPRTDVNDTTTYAYDVEGNLSSVTNPLGHVTQYTGYDAYGRVGTVSAPNGLVTTFTYHARGWPTSITVDGEQTTYGYDGAGQLTEVRAPGGEILTFGYDAARRLTSIRDAVGNTVKYTLDAKGNRTGEEYLDASGTLGRKIARAFNQLNLATSVTGGAQ